ncbi:MAG: zinc-binding dehydrogenase [Acidobacteriota bacterium]
MEALVWLGTEQLELRDLPVPEPAAGEAIVRVRYTGICGTDLHIFHGKHPRAKPPLVMGHEFCGHIARPGAGREDLREGDFVVGEPLISCGVCDACVRGYRHVCQKLGLYGIDRDGAFAEYLRIPAAKLLRVPCALTPEKTALVEPAAVAVHALRLSAIRSGDTVCVLGAGPMGLLTALVARDSGAQRVLICEREPMRIGLARDFGLEAINVDEVDPMEAIMEATSGRGADVVFEAAGSASSSLLAPKACRVRGQIVLIAMPKSPVPMDLVTITFRELALVGVRVYEPYDFERAMSFLAGSDLDFNALLSRPFPLKDGPTAFAEAGRGGAVMRVLFAPGRPDEGAEGQRGKRAKP